MVLVQGKHGLVENGSGTAHSGDPAHGAVIKVPYPYSNREIVRKSNAPVVPEVGRGSGLDRCLEGEAQGGVRSKGRRASRIVAQNV